MNDISVTLSADDRALLQALREGRPLTVKEKTIHSTGLVGVLKTLHDELDAAVLAAYGWSDLGLVPWGDEAARAASAASAAASTLSGSATVIKALSCGFSASMRANAAETSSRLDTVLAASASASCLSVFCII